MIDLETCTRRRAGVWLDRARRILGIALSIVCLPQNDANSTGRHEIVFSSTRTGNGDIFAMNADGSGLTRLTSSPGRDKVPSWSPDGNRIVFVSNREGNEDIFVMSADLGPLPSTSPVRQATSSPRQY